MLVLIRYGEIGLKSSQVKTRFVQQLLDNLERKLEFSGIDGDIVRREGRIFADVAGEDVADAVIALSRVPGVVSLSPVVTTDLSLDVIEETAVNMVEDTLETSDEDIETFAIDARRAGEHEYTSEDIERDVGQAVCDTHELDVDLDNPDLTVYIEARYKQAYLYTREVDGVGGLPVEERNGVTVLMEDRTATVAAYLLMKRGCKVYPVYTGHETEKLEEDMDILRQFDSDIKLTVMKGKGTTDALNQVCELYDLDAVAVSHTAEDIEDMDLPYVDAELLLPNSGLTYDEVMDIYADIAARPL